MKCQIQSNGKHKLLLTDVLVAEMCGDYIVDAGIYNPYQQPKQKDAAREALRPFAVVGFAVLRIAGDGVHCSPTLPLGQVCVFSFERLFVGDKFLHGVAP